MNIARITTYLQEYPDSTVAELATHFGYSRWHLSREFKRQSGVTLKQYSEAVKIQRSVELLLDQYSVTYSAIDAGYSSIATFSQTFKRHTGVNAREYVARAVEAQKMIRTLRSKCCYEYRRSTERTSNRLSVICQYPPGYRPHITFVGLFNSPLPKGNPVIGVALAGGKTTHIFRSVPAGQYYLLACDMNRQMDLATMSLLRTNYRQRHDLPLEFSEQTSHELTLAMRPPRADDPPITMNFAALLMRKIVQKTTHHDK